VIRRIVAALALAAAAFPTPAQRPLRRDAPAGPSCAAARAEVRDRIAAESASCERDLDCVPWEPELGGCELWVHRERRPGDDASQALEEACAGPAAADTCPPAVGACVRGRCAGRAPRRSGDCAAALRALAARVAERAPGCEENAECVALALPGSPAPAPAARAWPDLAAPELRDVEEACPGPSPDTAAAGEVVPLTQFPACLRGHCRLAADTPSAARWRKPALASPTCLHAALATAAAALRSEVVARFTVGKTGRAFGVSFEPPGAPAEAQAALREGVLGCRWRPGATASQDPARVQVRLPVRPAR
jgi:hypothetical protein